MRKVIFRIEIEMGNDAIKTAGDVRRTLTKLKDKVGQLSDSGEERKIKDIYGNSIGKWGFYLE